MSDFTRVEFKTRDGVTLRGNFYQPTGPSVGVVVMAGGFNLLKELNAGFAQMFQAAGYSALSFDHRSYGSSDGEPRQEFDPVRQADDFQDAISAGIALTGNNPTKVILWGIGHGGTAAMISAASDPRLSAAILQAPAPSGRLDRRNFSPGVLELAWQERERMTASGDTTRTYVKAFRDWLPEDGGDESAVFIRGEASYYLAQSNAELAAAAGTPWENHITLQSFINLARTESQDFLSRIRCPVLYVVHENDPFSETPAVHREIVTRQAPNVEFKVISGQSGDSLFELITAGVAFEIQWLKGIP